MLKIFVQNTQKKSRRIIPIVYNDHNFQLFNIDKKIIRKVFNILRNFSTEFSTFQQSFQHFNRKTAFLGCWKFLCILHKDVENFCAKCTKIATAVCRLFTIISELEKKAITFNIVFNISTEFSTVILHNFRSECWKLLCNLHKWKSSTLPAEVSNGTLPPLARQQITFFLLLLTVIFYLKTFLILFIFIIYNNTVLNLIFLFIYISAIE